MSKADGQKIVIQFTEKIQGDPSGLDVSITNPGEAIRPNGTATASSQYSSYAPTRAFDGSTGTYWYTRTTGEQWIQIHLTEPISVSGFNWYIGASHRPRAFRFQGSNDGASWTNIVADESVNLTGWQEFRNKDTEFFDHYRWTIDSRWSSYIYLYEIQLVVAVGNYTALGIEWQEKEYVVSGELVDRLAEITKIEMHPDYLDDKHVLLTVHPQTRFNNADGLITVSYDDAVGDLQGRGGYMESFITSFTPTDLVKFPPPYNEEKITLTPDAIVDFWEATYKDGYGKEKVTLTAGATIDFIYVGPINP